MASANRRISEAIDAVKQENYLLGLTMFLDVYGNEGDPPLRAANAASGLSWFGLCLALVQRQFKAAIELARRAIELEFYNGDHYANLTRIYLTAGNRKKALETAEAGLKLMPEHEGLLAARRAVGVRARPPLPFLDRGNAINVSLGQVRHAKKVAEWERRRK